MCLCCFCTRHKPFSVATSTMTNDIALRVFCVCSKWNWIFILNIPYNHLPPLSTEQRVLYYRVYCTFTNGVVRIFRRDLSVDCSSRVVLLFLYVYRMFASSGMENEMGGGHSAEYVNSIYSIVYWVWQVYGRVRIANNWTELWVCSEFSSMKNCARWCGKTARKDNALGEVFAIGCVACGFGMVGGAGVEMMLTSMTTAWSTCGPILRAKCTQNTVSINHESREHSLSRPSALDTDYQACYKRQRYWLCQCIQELQCGKVDTI